MKNFFAGIFKNFLPALKKFVPFLFKKIIGLISIKNLIIVGLVVGIIALVCLGLGGGWGGGEGDGEGDGDTKVETSQEETTEKEEEQKEDDYEGAIFAVTVAGNDYFFNNERIELEDLMDEFDKVEGSFVVEIKDDNASLKAYNALLDRLENSNIRYIEK